MADLEDRSLDRQETCQDVRFGLLFGITREQERRLPVDQAQHQRTVVEIGARVPGRTAVALADGQQLRDSGKLRRSPVGRLDPERLAVFAR